VGKTIFLREKNAVAPIFKKSPTPPYWWIRWVPSFLLALLIAYLLYVVGRIAVIPVLASFALAYILNPFAEAFQWRGLSRGLSAFLALAVVFVMLGVFVWFVIPDLWTHAAAGGDVIMRQFSEANAVRVRGDIREFSPMVDRLIGDRVYRFLRSPNELIQTSRTLAAGSLTSFFSTAAAVVDLLLIPFFVYYILVDFGRWRDSVEELIPPRFRDPLSRLFDEVGRILQSYVLGQLLIACLMGVGYAIGFALLRVPAWAGLAALAGFLNVVPYVGTVSGALLASGFTLAEYGSWSRVFGVIAVIITVQCIEGYYLTPRILGGRLRLHPMAVFLALLIAGKLFGFLGILLAIPTTAVLQVFWKFMREIYKGSYFYHGGQAPPAVALSNAPEQVAKAADAVLAEQVSEQKGDELLAPKKSEDDPIARQTELPRRGDNGVIGPCRFFTHRRSVGWYAPDRIHRRRPPVYRRTGPCPRVGVSSRPVSLDL
jgi:predicted PurR-regulated permease PerM